MIFAFFCDFALFPDDFSLFLAYFRMIYSLVLEASAYFCGYRAFYRLMMNAPLATKRLIFCRIDTVGCIKNTQFSADRAG